LKRLISFAALMLAVALLAATLPGQAPAAEKFQRISAEEAQKRIESGRPVVIVDVRSQEEFEQKRVKSAILIPNPSIGKTRPKELPDLDAEILVYCRSTMGSQEASEKLANLGYRNVFDFGSFRMWKGETESGPAQ
jgi:rhodanese-related sulfurtransferase